LIGMTLTFAMVAALAAVGGAWAVQANQYRRIVAMVVLAGFGLVLLLPGLSDWLTRPWWHLVVGCRMRMRAMVQGDPSRSHFAWRCDRPVMGALREREVVGAMERYLDKPSG
jgi:hypothetical protein